MRIGCGFDAHRFAAGRPLVLGGVRVPHDQGLLAHSDGDVLIHALCDALLGAAALGDIGRFFPDNDPAYAGVDSRVLLRRVPDRLLLREPDAGDVAHLRVLAEEKHVPIEVEPELPYLAVSLIKEVGA